MEIDKRNFYKGAQADGYYDSSAYLMTYERSLFMSLIKSSITNVETANILDAGCGGGDYLTSLRKLTKGSVYGVDASDEMLDRARNTIKEQGYEDQITLKKLDLVDDSIPSVLMVAEGFFDVAISCWVLCHAHNVDELRKMASNVAKSLKSGGKYYGVTFNPALTPKDFPKFKKYSFDFKAGDPTKEKLSDGDVFIYIVLDPNTGEEIFAVPSIYFEKQTLERVFKEAGFIVNKLDVWSKIVENPGVYGDRDEGIMFELTKI